MSYLDDTNDSAFRVLDSHAEYGVVLEARAVVYRRVEAMICVCVWDVHRLRT